MSCNHRRTAGDPHPACDSCLQEAGLKLCTQDETCELCVDLSKEYWDRKGKARVKREWRQRKRDSGNGNPEGEDKDSDVDVEETQTGRFSPVSEVDSDATRSHVEVIDSEDMLQDSEDSHDELDVSQARRHQQQEDAKEEKAAKLPPSPTQIANEMEFPDLLRFVEENSEYTLGDPVSSRPSSAFRLTSQGARDDKGPEFVALSLSSAIAGLAERRTIDALEGSHPHQLGAIPSFGNRGSMRSYQLSTPDLSVSPASHFEDSTSILRHVLKQSRSYVRDSDLALIEQSQRESLAIHSYMDAYLAAMHATVRGQDNPDPRILRLLSTTANGLADLARRSVHTLQQVTLHRRDMALWGSSLRPSLVAQLRHAPFLAQKSLFDRVLLMKAQEELKEDQMTQVISKAAKAPSSRPLHSTPPKQDKKRSMSSPQSFSSTQGPAKKKLSLPKPTPVRPVTKTSQGQQKYR